MAAIFSKLRSMRRLFGRIKPSSTGTGTNGDLLRSKYAKNSTLALGFARLILVGLAVEIAAVFILQKPWLEGWLTIAANTLIWLGVWGELRFEKRAMAAGDGIVAEANARAEEANEKAEKERLERVKIEQEILKQLRPRGFSKQQFDDLVSALNGKVKQLSVHTLTDTEARSFGFTIMDALTKAGVKYDWIEPAAEKNVFLVEGINSTGLSLYVANAHKDTEAEELVQTLMGAFAKAGVSMVSLLDVPSPSLFVAKQQPPFIWFPEYLAPDGLPPPPWEPK